MSDAGYVLDASAILAALQEEPGSDTVYAAVPASIVGAVNYSEVIAKLCERGSSEAFANDTLRQLQLVIVDFDREQASVAGGLRTVTRKDGLSLGDRACLALALAQGRIVLTSDKRLARAKTPAKVQEIR